MASIPFMFRVGMFESERNAQRDSFATLEEPLPTVVEVDTGGFVHAGTRVTEVKRETTDDS